MRGERDLTRWPSLRLDRGDLDRDLPARSGLSSRWCFFFFFFFFSLLCALPLPVCSRSMSCSCLRRTGFFKRFFLACSSCFFMRKRGSALILAAKSTVVLALEDDDDANKLPGAEDELASASAWAANGSTALSIFFPSKYSSWFTCAPGPEYIQSRRLPRSFITPVSMACWCISSRALSSCSSRRSWSIFFFSWSRFCSAFHTRSKFCIVFGWKLFFMFKSPPPMVAGLSLSAR